MFGLDITKVVALMVVALLVFGPERLPKVAAEAGRALRQLRQLVENARAGLGPEFANLDVTELHPKTLARKYLLDEADESPAPAPAPTAVTNRELGWGEIPPYDPEST
ncbi:sec-independent translocase [Microtetraspora malaysiensis]|uniref:sec-independent translocase n=1 Tax=Microtetraspora malaysiensis TaxID=161358 RepID=UPI003D8C52BE